MAASEKKLPRPCPSICICAHFAPPSPPKYPYPNQLKEARWILLFLCLPAMDTFGTYGNAHRRLQLSLGECENENKKRKRRVS